jgi:hypothetical protein
VSSPSRLQLTCQGQSWQERQGWFRVSPFDAAETKLTHSRLDLASPHILRSLSNVKIVSIHTGCASAHSICIDSKLLLLCQTDRQSGATLMSLAATRCRHSVKSIPWFLTVHR